MEHCQVPLLQAAELLEGRGHFPLPKIVPIAQRFPRSQVVNPAAAVRKACQHGGLAAQIRPAMRIGLAVGSRGISNQVAVLRALITLLQELGAQLAIIPAMGSHGGPSAAGQVEVLAGLGISEAALGIPVCSSLAVRQIGQTAAGLPVWFSADALDFDGIIVVNRVKPHTDFQGEIESGILKMCAVGLGKHKGASLLHAQGFANLGASIQEAAHLVLAQANVLGGLAIVENAYKDVAKVAYLPNQGNRLAQEEMALLEEARTLMPSLPFAAIDVLLVQQIGKDISGAMFDPNITGRRKIWGVADLPTPQVKVMAALELTAASHGNAAGLSVADLCSSRLLQQVDWPATYASLITATLPQHAYIPMFFGRDEEIVRVAMQIACASDPAAAGLVWIEDTAHIDRLWVSVNLLPQLQEPAAIEILAEAQPLPFSAAGLLSWRRPE